MSQEFWVNFVQFTNTNPLFKGTAVALAGLAALLFAWWLKEKWGEPLKGGFLVFIALAVFIIIYGLFILVARPSWWNPPQ